MNEIVRQGYNSIAQRYTSARASLKSAKYVHKLLKLLPKKSTVLDLGCGSGVGVDDYLLKAGHTVIGIDNSKAMIKLARINCPAGEYIEGDIQDLALNDYRVEAVVSFYALFHISREKHAEILKCWASYLPTNGLLLVTMGDRAFEGTHDLFGVRMWSSQWGAEKNLEIVKKAGLEIVEHAIDMTGAERHLVVLARKR